MTAGPCELTSSAHAALAALEQAGLTRSLRAVERCGPARVRVDGRELVSFASCDYLGLATHPELAEASARAALERGTSAGGARLLSGHDEQVAALESELAAFFGAPSALVFGSGYLANLGLVAGLAGPGDLLLSDRLVHASTIDATRLSGARVSVFEHGDVDAVHAALLSRPRGTRALVLVEGVYSMDGDLAPLDALAPLCAEQGASLLVDDAHGLGAVGPGGRGALAAHGLPGACAAQAGNLGKALGSYGAFLLLGDELRELLLQTARSFVFTCALPPSVVAAARAALAVLSSSEGQERVRALQQRAAMLRAALRRHGVPQDDRPAAGPDSEDPDHTTARLSPIIPVRVGSGRAALSLSARLLERGWLVPAVRPPTVPRGEERLRLTVSAQHTPEHCRALADDLAEMIHE